MKNYFYITVFALVIGLISASCSHDSKKPGRIYMPDMTYSNALEAYSSSVIVNEDGDSVSTRKPVKGTIPRGWIPADENIRSNSAYLLSYTAKNHFTHDAAKWQEEYDKAAGSIKDPLPFTQENKDAGKKLYTIHCVNCHGEAGDGQGNLIVLANGQDGPYTAVPPNYKKRLPEIKDGNIFYSVSYGKGMMGGYGYSLSVNERWQVIHYIKGIAGIEGDATGSGAVVSKDALAMDTKKMDKKDSKK